MYVRVISVKIYKLDVLTWSSNLMLWHESHSILSQHDIKVFVEAMEYREDADSPFTLRQTRRNNLKIQ